MTKRIPHGRRRSRGFTLVELLLASTAGLIVASAAFLLAKNASSVFQEETRITGAQLSATLGLQRLVNDLARAGFLTTPNAATDPTVCHEDATWPQVLLNMKAVTIEQGGSVSAHPGDLTQSVANGMNPDRISIAGAFDSAERFPVWRISDGASKVVNLQTNVQAVYRACQGKTLVLCDPDLQRIFKTGRILRILTPKGTQIFGIIDHLATTATSLQVFLQPTPTVPSSATNPRGYDGVAAPCLGCLANVVSVVRYEIQSMTADPNYGALVAPVAGPATGDTGRTELVRSELDRDGVPIIGSTELVSEYAVDLKFGISTIDQLNTAITDLPIALPENPAIYTTKPERIRSVHVRLATRARAPDRQTDMTPGPDGRKNRFQMTLLGKLTYARMRTLYSEVALQNLVRATW